MPNSMDPDQTAPMGAVCSGSALFASILNSSVILGNYLQQATSPDDIFRCIFSRRYQVCSNYGPGTKNGPIPGAHMFYIGKKMKTYSCLKPQGAEP